MAGDEIIGIPENLVEYFGTRRGLPTTNFHHFIDKVRTSCYSINNFHH
jgi:hypothetical protein